MSLTRTLQSLKTAALLGGVLGLGYGCVIEFDEIEPCDSGSNNKLTDDGQCECRIGYEWCNPDDPDDLNCCDTSNADEVGDGDGDQTGDGDSGDGDGDTGDGDGDTGDGDGDGDGDTGTLPPDSCSPDEEGFVWCTHTVEMGPEGSQFFICTDGEWVEDNAYLEDECTFNGWDFAYGCVDNAEEMKVEPICGDGPGTTCNNDDALFCADDDNLASCVYGKETWDSCQYFCENEGIDEETFEYGECDDSIPDDIACFCCNSGDPGCPI